MKIIYLQARGISRLPQRHFEDKKDEETETR